jgi:hypothetical protein
VPDQRLGIDTKQFALTDRKGHDWERVGVHLLGSQFFVEGRIGIAING